MNFPTTPAGGLGERNFSANPSIGLGEPAPPGLIGQSSVGTSVDRARPGP